MESDVAKEQRNLSEDQATVSLQLNKEACKVANLSHQLDQKKDTDITGKRD